LPDVLQLLPFTRSLREFLDGEQVPPPGQVWPLSDKSNLVLKAALTASLSPGSVSTPFAEAQSAGGG
jgi:hypothetical protein